MPLCYLFNGLEFGPLLIQSCPFYHTKSCNNQPIIEHLRIISFPCSEGLEDPLEDTGMVAQQLEQVSVIARCEYGKTCALLVALFDSAAGGYQENRPTQDPQRLVYQGI